MGRRHNRQGSNQSQSWEFERSLASAEADTESEGTGSTACPCGSAELLVEAYMSVVDGKLQSEPVELGTLTCPQCGREFEAIQGAPGQVIRGDFLGMVDIGEDE